MNNELPQLSKMIIPSFLTFRKGVRISESGIHVTKKFDRVYISQDSLQKYVDYIGWGASDPFCYLFILAMRAQLPIMLSKEFSIAIPGMIHIENDLNQLHNTDFAASFDLQVSVDVDYKPEGSLIPVFKVDFYQNELKVATCKSTYLAMRKKKASAKKERKDETPALESDYKEAWQLTPKIGKDYARASGDKNPIHTSTLFAKLMGFKSPIAHGWYSVSRIVNALEMHYHANFKRLNVSFKNPAFLPSTQILEAETGEDGNFNFTLEDKTSTKLTLTGSVS